MKTYLLNFWDTVRSSYWFVPSLFAVAAVFMSLALPWVDLWISGSEMPLPDWVLTNTATARTTLSAIAGAMVAVTGTVFSITIVTLSLASQQFGPRLLRRFMYDLPTQVTLGVFLSTGFYCLLLLRLVEGREGVASPHLSVLFAVVLTVWSMAMLILFIHHVAILIQAPHVVAAVAEDLDDAIVRLFPDKIGQGLDELEVHGRARVAESQLGDHFTIARSTQEGYIQAIDSEGLLYFADSRNLVVRMRSRPGNFIAIGSPLAEIWRANPVSEEGDGDASNDELTQSLNETVIVGLRRTPRQDVECAIDEIVEVAVRALSPGVNDPFTAINCIDRLGAALGRVAEREMPSAYRCNEDGRLRVVTRPVSFTDVLDAAFNQIRQYSRDSVAVTLRLLEALASIATHVKRNEDLEAVRHHAEMVSRSSTMYSEEYDKDEIRRRVLSVEEMLARR